MSRYFIVTNLAKQQTTYVNTIEELENITGWCRTCFLHMLPGEVYYISDYQVVCAAPAKEYKIDNLWRDAHE